MLYKVYIAIKIQKSKRLLIICTLGFIQLVFAFRYFIPGVYADQWDLVPILDLYYSGEPWLREVFSRHGDHLHSAAYLLMLGLASLTDWNLLAEIAAIIVVNIGTFVLIYRNLIKQIVIEQSRFAGQVVFAFVSLYFSLSHAGNLLWTWQLAVYTSIFGAVLAILKISRVHFGLLNFIFAIFGALVSSFSFSCGFVLWPVGTLVLILNPSLSIQEKGLFIFVWLAIAVLVFHYFFLATNGVFSQNLDLSLIHSLKFSLIALGTPLSYFSRDLSPIIGAFGFVCFIFYGFKIAFIHKQWRTETFLCCLGFSCFAIGSVVLISMGRAELGFDQARSFRYIIFSQFFWLSLFVLIWFNSVFSKDSSKNKSWKFSNLVLLSTIILIYFNGQKIARSSAQTALEYRVNLAVFDSAEYSLRDQYVPVGQYPPKLVLERYINILKKHNLNIYHE